MAASKFLADFTPEWHVIQKWFVARHDIVRKPEYVAEIDEYRLPNGKQLLLGHLRFHAFNKTTFKQLLKEWSVVRSLTEAPIFVYAMEGDPIKFEKFISWLGFKPTDVFAPADTGEMRRVFISQGAE
jgi:hypothetical protein